MQPALTPETPAVTAAAATSSPAEAVVPTTDAARAPIKAPENAQSTAAELAQPAATAAANDASLAPTERPKLPEVKPAEPVPASAPNTLESITQTVELLAAKQAGQLIAEANAAGAKLPVEGLAVTVTIGNAPAVTTAAPEAHVCSGAECNHAVSPAKSDVTPAQPAVETAAVATTPVVENVVAPAAPATAPVEASAAIPAQAQVAAPAVEQPVVGEVKPAELSMAATVPAKIIETPAANVEKFEQKLVANGAAR